MIAHRKNRFHQFYMAHFKAPLLRFMIGDSAEFLLKIDLKRCVNKDLIAVIHDAKAENEVENEVYLKNQIIKEDLQQI